MITLNVFELLVLMTFPLCILVLPKVCSSYLKKIQSPTGSDVPEYELNWAIKETFDIFSKPMSDRWYEARALQRRGIFISLLCAFGVVTLVCVEFEISDSRLCSFNSMYLGVRSVEWIKEKLPALVKRFSKEIPEEGYYYQTFVVGRNVIDSGF